MYIVQVQSGKAADKAGLKRGDRILEVDGKEIKEVSDVKSVISSHKAGDTIKIKIERDNKEQTVSVTLLEVSDNTTRKNSFYKLKKKGIRQTSLILFYVLLDAVIHSPICGSKA